ncbi:SDR family NAD(P)-dependent oxidoreductase [Aurantimonas sp. VKM B-3413]|uniref:SDR family NAD(P)-dependent oxidoreductase n=1 Tax=Aurantimonas sp. VKM B-3413 TaxID=2779401 RepID=UPI001E595F3E|nr:SDR family NAD(P)-dependent oxidoreductase [Aurantimonas sp. VKM B-3413]MCB8836797.1 SDR family NAD(P)-dependent oxidoreductase [Aurantimonas sp. VKM B-3413]
MRGGGSDVETRPVALISGANRGIGEAVSRRLSQDGWALSLGMRRPEMPDFADPERTHLFAYDATTSAEDAWVAEAMARFGRIDAVVANAGVMIPKTVIEAEDEDLDRMFAVNVKAPRRLVKAAFEPLAAGGRGRVIIIASLSGKRVKSAKSGLYAMTKFAAVALAHGIRQSGYDRGIRATAICPGFVDTQMARSITDREPEAMTDPAELADAIAMLIGLSNTASVAEFAVNCQLEEQY